MHTCTGLTHVIQVRLILFKRLLQSGWTNMSATDPSCTKDVDECVNSPCSSNPPVLCTNTPGSYACGACPSGSNFYKSTLWIYLLDQQVPTKRPQAWVAAGDQPIHVGLVYRIRGKRFLLRWCRWMCVRQWWLQYCSFGEVYQHTWLLLLWLMPSRWDRLNDLIVRLQVVCLL